MTEPRVLTPVEERVASLVAAGLTNAEIAQELELSVKTVEGNLTRVYRKLRVRSRTELALRFAAVARGTLDGGFSLEPGSGRI